MRIFATSVFRVFDCVYLSFLFIPLFYFLRNYFYNNIWINNNNKLFSFGFFLSLGISVLLMGLSYLGLITLILAIFISILDVIVIEFSGKVLRELLDNKLYCNFNSETKLPEDKANAIKDIFYKNGSDDEISITCEEKSTEASADNSAGTNTSHTNVINMNTSNHETPNTSPTNPSDTRSRVADSDISSSSVAGPSNSETKPVTSKRKFPEYINPGFSTRTKVCVTGHDEPWKQHLKQGHFRPWLFDPKDDEKGAMEYIRKTAVEENMPGKSLQQPVLVWGTENRSIQSIIQEGRSIGPPAPTGITLDESKILDAAKENGISKTADLANTQLEKAKDRLRDYRKYLTREEAKILFEEAKQFKDWSNKVNMEIRFPITNEERQKYQDFRKNTKYLNRVCEILEKKT